MTDITLPAIPYKFRPGQRVRKIGGSYQYDGHIRAAFPSLDGQPRYVFMFDVPAGLLHIMNESQLEAIDESELEYKSSASKLIRLIDACVISFTRMGSGEIMVIVDGWFLHASDAETAIDIAYSHAKSKGLIK